MVYLPRKERAYRTLRPRALASSLPLCAPKCLWLFYTYMPVHGPFLSWESSREAQSVSRSVVSNSSRPHE